MTRDGFDAWLAAPLPGLDIVENPSAMYTGWAVDGAAADWELTEIAGHPKAVAGIRADRGRTPLERLAARAARGFTLVRHRADALEVYLYDYHADGYGTQTDLLMLAGAGRFAAPDAEAAVMYWGGNVDPGLPVRGDDPLAVLLVGDARAPRARFVDRHPLDALVEELRPVETDFLAASVDHGDESYGWDAAEVLDPAVRARIPAES